MNIINPLMIEEEVSSSIFPCPKEKFYSRKKKMLTDFEHNVCRSSECQYYMGLVKDGVLCSYTPSDDLFSIGEDIDSTPKTAIMVGDVLSGFNELFPIFLSGIGEFFLPSFKKSNGDILDGKMVAIKEVVQFNGLYGFKASNEKYYIVMPCISAGSLSESMTSRVNYLRDNGFHVIGIMLYCIQSDSLSSFIEETIMSDVSWKVWLIA